MGNGMVKKLLQHGFEVNAYTRTRAKALEALDAGAVWRENVADCVRDADAVITIAVSYTHLDVYKRQQPSLPFSSIILPRRTFVKKK